MNIVKNFTTIHLLLSWINVLQVVILLMSNLTEGLNLSMFNMITGINKLKTLTKHACIMRRKFNSDQWWNNEKCRCECKKRHVCEKDYI